MTLLIADSFTDSLARLTGPEQKAVKACVFDLHLQPGRPGFRFHRIVGAADSDFWSVRVNRDLRLIVHKRGERLLLCHVGHHDAAYAWARRRRIARHPKTGAMQLVVLPEVAAPEERPSEDRLPEAPDTPPAPPPSPDSAGTPASAPAPLAPTPSVPPETPPPPPTYRPWDGTEENAHAPLRKRQITRPPRPVVISGYDVADDPPLFGVHPHEEAQQPFAHAPFLKLSTDEILSVGVPEELVEAVRNATENAFLALCDDLPQEAAEALFDYLVTGELRVPETHGPDGDPYQHPDAERRFRILEGIDELRRALDFPWEKWTIFLHPAQRRHVEARVSGPVRIGGTAGTGKTVVALHRAAHLAHAQAGRQVLLTTFSRPLAQALALKLDRLLHGADEVRRRIRVEDARALAYRLHAELFGRPNIARASQQRAWLEELAQGLDDPRFTPAFLWREWRDVVDAWQLFTFEAYRDVPRLGRRTRLGARQREQLWAVFDALRKRMAERGVQTWAQVFARVSDHYRHAPSPFDAVVVDEAQDMGVPEIRLFAALGRSRADGLFFTGDLGQRIFQTPFSWLRLGVDVRGRSHALKVNYRTSHQIRRQADRLLPEAITDVDGIVEERTGTISVFNGPEPEIRVFDSAEEEAARVGEWILELVEDGLALREIGIFVRSRKELSRARRAARAAGLPWRELAERIDEDGAEKPERLVLGTMHLAKGLEFRAVAVMACDDEVIPDQERIDRVIDEADLEDVYATERHLLYVACTRAREHLWVSGVAPESEFIGDLMS